jgi:hypothetical protein
MGIRPVFKDEHVIDVPILSDIDRDRMIEAWGKFKTEPLKLIDNDR